MVAETGRHIRKVRHWRQEEQNGVPLLRNPEQVQNLRSQMEAKREKQEQYKPISEVIQ